MEHPCGRTKEDAEKNPLKIIEAAWCCFSRNGFSKYHPGDDRHRSVTAAAPYTGQFQEQGCISTSAVLACSQSPSSNDNMPRGRGPRPVEAIDTFARQVGVLAGDIWFRQVLEILLNKDRADERVAPTLTA